MSQIDLSKLEEQFPGFKMSDTPAKVHFRSASFDASQILTYWLGEDGENRQFQIQALILKDPAKAAKKIELDLSEKEAALLYMKLTEFLKQTVKRAMTPQEKSFIVRCPNFGPNTPRECSIYSELEITLKNEDAMPPHCDDCNCTLEAVKVAK